MKEEELYLIIMSAFAFVISVLSIWEILILQKEYKKLKDQIKELRL